LERGGEGCNVSERHRLQHDVRRDGVQFLRYRHGSTALREREQSPLRSGQHGGSWLVHFDRRLQLRGSYVQYDNALLLIYPTARRWRGRFGCDGHGDRRGLGG